MHKDLAPDRLLGAYAAGIFPMADESDELHWFAPDPRAVIELADFSASRSLRAVLRREKFTVTFDTAFDQVIDACADRKEGTWISRDVREAYETLHRLGFAHSVEAWSGEMLAGGLYGVALGGAFFGESMFHRQTDASKVALVHLVTRMQEQGFELLDAQFMTDHLRSLGAVEIPRADYERRLDQALTCTCRMVEPDHPDLSPKSSKPND